MTVDVAQRPIRVAVLGTRGIPDVQGGIETHCQHLFPRLAGMGFDITLYARRGYVKTDDPYDFEGVHIVPLKCSHKACFEAVTHVFRCYGKIRKSPPRYRSYSRDWSGIICPAFPPDGSESHLHASRARLHASQMGQVCKICSENG